MFEDEGNDYEGFGRFENMPLYLKAMEISELVDHNVESVEKSDIEFKDEYRQEMLKNNLQYMMENSLIIPA